MSVARTPMRILASLVLLALGSVGCSPLQPRVDELAGANQRSIDARYSDAVEQVTQREKLALALQDVAKPFIVGAVTPLDRAVAQPEFLRSKITMYFNRGAVPLMTAVEQISQAARVQITVTPDGLMPASAFAARTGSAGSPTTSLVTLSNLPPNLMLFEVLDEMTRQLQVSWRASGRGVEIYRTQTKIFNVSALARTFTNSAGMARTAGRGESFTATNSTTFETKGVDVYQTIEKTITSLLTVGGRVVASPETQSLIVTDVPSSLAMVENFINTTNKSFSRRVRLVVEVLDITSKDGSEVGLDWNLISKGLSGGSDVTANSPSSLTGLLGGGMKLLALDGKMAGSSLVVKALAEAGMTVNRRTFPLVTDSGKPVSHAIRKTFSYVDQVSQTTTTSATTAPVAPTVSQKEETVGTFLNLLPTARADGQINLILSYDQSDADPLVPFTTGSGTNSVTLQQKTINGTASIREVTLRSGQTLLVGGLETALGQTNSRRLAPGAPLIAGGSDKTAINTSSTVILVTAVTEEGI